MNQKEKDKLRKYAGLTEAVEADSAQGESWEGDINFSIIVSIDGVSKRAEAQKLLSKFTDFFLLSRELAKVMDNFEKKE